MKNRMRRIYAVSAMLAASVALLHAGNQSGAYLSGKSAPSPSAVPIGFSDGNCATGSAFRIGSTSKQGIAIKLSGAKLKALKGCSISGVEAAFGVNSSSDKEATVFVSTSPDGVPLRTATATVAKPYAWQQLALDEPYVITGDEECLYVGYTVKTNIISFALSTDRSADSEGLGYVYKDGQWVDMYGLGVGMPNVRALVDDAPSLTDAMLKTMRLDGYYKQATPYKYGTQLFNFGTTPINSFEAVLRVGDESHTVKFDNLDIAPSATYDLALPELAASVSGRMPVSIEVASINGNAVDASPEDNTVGSSVCFYPKDMERSLLLESFTSQSCTGCPAGHRLISDFLALADESVVEVTHHSGYYPDIFTMAEDMDCTWFYGGEGTYAPAFMMNRTTVEAISSTSPVLGVTASNLKVAEVYASSLQPYVALGLHSSYQPETREVKVKLTVEGINDLPSDGGVLNVMLIQDGMVAPQTSGGGNYVHNSVFRGTLTGETFGIALPEDFKAGSKTEWETTYTLPEAIRSSYWTDENLSKSKYTVDDVTLPVDLDNMYLVAYVGARSDTKLSGNTVYNCVKVRLGESHDQYVTDGIADATEDSDAPTVSVADRRIVVDGRYNRMAVYTVSGRRVAADSSLASGVYIVRVEAGGKISAKKVMVN